MSIPTTTPAGETYDQTVNTLGTLQDQLVDMAEGFIRALPNFAIAILILLVTWIVARLAVRGVSRAIGKTDMRPSLQNLIDTVVKLGIWIIGLMIALIVVMPGMVERTALEMAWSCGNFSRIKIDRMHITTSRSMKHQ